MQQPLEVMKQIMDKSFRIKRVFGATRVSKDAGRGVVDIATDSTFVFARENSTGKVGCDLGN